MEPKFELFYGFLNLAILPFKFDLSLYLILTNVPSYRNQKGYIQLFRHVHQDDVNPWRFCTAQKETIQDVLNVWF